MGKYRKLWASDWALASLIYPLKKLKMITHEEAELFYDQLGFYISLCKVAMNGKKDEKEKARQEVIARNLEWLYCPLNKSWLKKPTAGTDGTDI